MDVAVSPLLNPDLLYLAEGGQETELMYGHGHDLPEFALFPMLDDPDALADLTAMYRAVLDVAAARGMGVVLGGLDYRASPDWAGLIGLDAAGLSAFQHRSIDFLREVTAPFRDRIPHLLVCGAVGPQGDAYQRNEAVTRDSARAYHATQIATLAEAGADVVELMTFTSADEAIGAVLAARDAGLPVIVSIMPHEGAILGTTLDEAVARVDDATGGYTAFFGLNCSHPLEFVPLLEGQEGGLKRLGMIRPNASSKEKVELCQIGHLERGDPRDLGRRMGELAKALPHVQVWGGCCGTWDEHLGEIADAVIAARADA